MIKDEREAMKIIEDMKPPEPEMMYVSDVWMIFIPLPIIVLVLLIMAAA